MIASLVAKQVGVERTIVRIRGPRAARDARATNVHSAIGADLIIDPDEEAARDIIELLEFPGASEVEVFGGGEALVIGAVLHDGLTAGGEDPARGGPGARTQLGVPVRHHLTWTATPSSPEATRS